MAATQGPWAERCTGDVLSAAAWKDKPSWYVLASNDHMIDPVGQAHMAERIRAKIFKVNASHVPMLSHPQDVASAIVAAADAVA